VSSGTSQRACKHVDAAPQPVSADRDGHKSAHGILFIIEAAAPLSSEFRVVELLLLLLLLDERLQGLSATLKRGQIRGGIIRNFDFLMN
jgi:hypothetical protein